MIVKIGKSKLNGKIKVPGSKSLGHRALICAYLSNLPQKIILNWDNDDIKTTINCLQDMGANISVENNAVLINGNKKTSKNKFTCKESASTLRFLLPLTTLNNDKVVFNVGQGLINRPMSPYEKYFNLKKDHLNNLIIANKCENTEIYEVEGNISSQFITGLIFYIILKKNVKIKIAGEVESKPYIDMTIEVLKKYGVEVSEQNNLFYINKIEFKPLEYIVESDYSSASNFIVYNALTNGNIEILNLSNKIIQADSMIHDLLKKIDKKEIISLKNCPDLGPILFVYAAFKNYETIFIDVKRLEFKESNRIISMQEELRKTGIDFKYDGDKVIIKGKEVHNSNFVFETHNDHRVAMALSVFAMINNGNSIINNAEVVNKSFPSFYKILQELKADIKII